VVLLQLALYGGCLHVVLTHSLGSVALISFVHPCASRSLFFLRVESDRWVFKVVNGQALVGQRGLRKDGVAHEAVLILCSFAHVPDFTGWGQRISVLLNDIV
jgi:hypothetical protein